MRLAIQLLFFLKNLLLEILDLRLRRGKNRLVFHITSIAWQTFYEYNKIITMSKNTRILLLTGILIIAAFFRLWQLDSIPPGLFPDEAMNGNNAFEALHGGGFKIFYRENNGREGLFINIQALSMK